MDEIARYRMDCATNRFENRDNFMPEQKNRPGVPSVHRATYVAKGDKHLRQIHFIPVRGTLMKVERVDAFNDILITDYLDSWSRF